MKKWTLDGVTNVEDPYPPPTEDEDETNTKDDLSTHYAHSYFTFSETLDRISESLLDWDPDLRFTHDFDIANRGYSICIWDTKDPSTMVKEYLSDTTVFKYKNKPFELITHILKPIVLEVQGHGSGNGGGGQ